MSMTLDSIGPKANQGVGIERACSFKNYLCAVFLFCVALTTSTMVADGRYGLTPDGAREINVALNLVDGKGLTTAVASESKPPELRPLVTKPPLYHVAIALLINAGVSPKSAGWSIAQGAFVISVVLLFFLARVGLPLIPAFVIGLLYAMLMSSLKWGVYVKEDTLYVALSIAALLYFVLLRNRSGAQGSWHWLLLGVISAAAILTRYIGITLIAAITALLVYDALSERRFRRIGLYFAGLALVGSPFFIRFLTLWVEGVRPSFSHNAETTWYLIVSGVMNAFQRDFTGRLLIWFEDGSAVDQIVLAISFAVLVALLLWGLKMRRLAPVVLYIGIYLAVLIVQLAGQGHFRSEPRFMLPVEGLLILVFAAFFWWVFRQQKSRKRCYMVISLALLFVGVYINGQWSLFLEFRYPPSASATSSREYCPSPDTIAWVKSHVPPGEVVFASQCGFQLLAESNEYYWLAIPPANKYANSPDYDVRWMERDFVEIKNKTGARWIVLLMGESGDPLGEEPGYGPFVSSLISGSETDQIRMRATYQDGIVYEIK